MEHTKLDTDLVALHRRGAWDASTALMYTIDSGFQIVAVNAAWERFIRGNQSEPLLQQRVEGANLLEAMREPWRSETEVLCRAIFDRQLPQHEAMHDYSTIDSRCILHTVITPLVNEQDEIIGAAFTSHDFTAHRALQNELSQQGEQLDVLGRELQRLQRIAVQLIADTDPTGSLHSIMQAIAEAVPRAALALLRIDQMTGDFAPQVVTLPNMLDLKTIAVVLRPLLAGLRSRPGQIDVVGYSDIGTALGLAVPRVRAVWLQPLRGREGQLLGCVVCSWPVPYRLSPLVHQLLNVYAAYAALAIENASLYAAEVVARREAERQGAVAAAGNAQLIATLRAMADSVILCDQQGRIVLANEATERLFQYTPHLLGPTITALAKQFGIAAPYDQLGLDQAILNQVMQGECEVRREDGTRTLQIEARPVRAADGMVLGAVAVVHDATEERMAVRLKEEFLSVAAHELKTPVTTLKGYAQLALKRIANLPDMEPIRRSLHTIDDQADRITRLVSQLLDVSSIHAGRLELDIARFELVEMLQEVLQAEERKTPGPALHLSGAAMAWVDADLDRIEQVVRGVVRSIRKFASEGSVVEVEVHCGRMVEVVMVEQLVSGPTEVAHVHQAAPVMTSRAEMSLGLHIMQAIVERHGGEMRIEGGNGQRLWISLTLPATHGTGRRLAAEEGADIR